MVVQRLLSRGHTVRVLARGTRPGLAMATETVPGSVLRPETLPAACGGVDAIIHLVGIISEVGDQTFERVHTEGTRNILQAAQSEGLRRFIHMSALGTRPNAVARYHRSKWMAEEAVRSSGLDWTIFRPSLIYGPGDGPFDRVIRMILEATGRPRGLVHLPLPIARLQAGILEKVFPGMLNQAPPLNRDQIQMLQEDNVGDPGPASEVFGFIPRSFEEGLARLFLRG